MKSNSSIENVRKYPLSSFTLLPLLPIAVLIILITFSCRKNTGDNINPGLQVIADNLVSPLTLAEAPDGSKRLFVVDQVGKVWIIAPDGTKMPSPFLDITSKLVALNPGYDERGLLGFAFHPDFKNNGKLYVFYNTLPRAGGPAAGVSWNNLCRVSEFKTSGSNPNLVDLTVKELL